jgi:hypothetical protein
MEVQDPGREHQEALDQVEHQEVLERQFNRR